MNCWNKSYKVGEVESTIPKVIKLVILAVLRPLVRVRYSEIEFCDLIELLLGTIKAPFSGAELWIGFRQQDGVIVYNKKLRELNF